MTLFPTKPAHKLYYSKSQLSAQRAGLDGFSIVRQPVKWGEESKNDEEDSRSWKQKMKARREDALKAAAPPSSFFGPNSYSGSPTNYVDNVEEDQQDISTTIDHINLHRRTRETLDYVKVWNALQSMCVTVPAKLVIQHDIRDSLSEITKGKTLGEMKNDKNDIRSMRLSASSVQGIHDRYGAVKEMQMVLSITSIKPFPLTGYPNLDIGPLFEFVESTNQPLEGADIVEITDTIEKLQEVSDWCLSLNDKAKRSKTQPHKPKASEDGGTPAAAAGRVPPFVHLVKLGEYIDIDSSLQDLLKNALDDKGRLSGTTFPGIGRLRSKVEQLQKDILATVNQLIQKPEISSKLATESGGSIISEVDGRIVIPIDVRYKNSVGIVHDMSRSGKTSYVEPKEIVESTNELRQTEGELRQEEARIWRSLTEEIMNHRVEIEQAIAAAAQLDLVMARIRLGNKWNGIIPHVHDEGVIQLTDARHPILLLRELENVVGSDIDLGSGNNQGLVLTGPNSGGKTVILKLIGLFALMARDGIPIPAQSARVDFFSPVLADIGDIQSVGGDLSTFSGHMLVCREVLASSGKNALVLMDELGSGTDPAQGVAIAQALLESLVETGARVVITTHYMALKQLAASDERFAVAGMQFSNGRPTYKLLPGTVGESFALSVAERLNLPPSVIQRANELLDKETRQMGDLITKLEEQRAVIDQQVADLARRQKEMEELQEEMQRAQSKLVQQQLNARREEAKKFAGKLEEKERILEDILNMLKSDPTKRLVAKSWEDLQYVKREAFREAEFVSGRKKEAPSDSMELIPISELDDKPQLKVGDSIIVCKPGFAMGKEGLINKVTEKALEVSVGGMSLRMKYSEVALPSEVMSLKLSAEREAKEVKERKMSKFARRALEEDQGLTDVSHSKRNEDVETSSQPTMRTSSNTLDLRGW
jgi:DNA mismatch repair protein MutS2